MRTWIVVAGAGGAAVVGARIAYARHHRVLHPRGRSFTGELEVWGLPGGPVGADLLDWPGRYRVTVRVSKGVPTPAGWPDLLGLAVRVHEPGRARPFDLLMSTSGRGPLLRHLPLPRRRFATLYSSLLPLHADAGRLYLAALPDPRSAPLGGTLDTVTAAAVGAGARFVLAVASPGGEWRPFARLLFGRPLPGPVDARLAFDPTRHQAPGLRPVGAVQALRGLTYRWSQRWRGADVETDGPSLVDTVTAPR